jgi:hypothetical protein
VLAIVAISVAVLMGFAGMAVDVGFLEYEQRQQQSAADGAAIGGAEALLYGTGCPNSTAAIGDAAENGFTNGSGGVTVVPHNPPLSGPLASNNCAVYVQVNSPHPVFFAKLFGLTGNESTEATAMVAGNNNGCIYLLKTNAVSSFSNSDIVAPECQIYINSAAASNLSSATVGAAAISYAGAPPNISGATFPEATPAPAPFVRDPCPNITGCAYLANNPPSTSTCSTGSNSYSGATLNPGCYSTLTLSGTDTLNAGLYVINGKLHLNGATVIGNGVTIYMTSAVQDTNFSSSNLTLSPPTSGNTIGVLFYRDPAQTSALDFSTCTCNLSGLEYFPTSQVNYSSSGGGYSVLVFGNANFGTSAAIDLADPPPGQTLVKQAVLAE